MPEALDARYRGRRAHTVIRSIDHGLPEDVAEPVTPNVVNEADVERIERSHGEAFASRRARLGEAAGGEDLGCSLYEIPPGKSHCPYHYHSANEEAVYVLEGEGTLRSPAGKTVISEGDYVAFLTGLDGAHRIENSADETLRYLCFSTMREPEVVTYPDSEKIGVYGMETPGSPRKLFPASAEVDYWDGES